MNVVTKIKIRDLYKRFGNKVVLDNLNLDIYDKQSLVILGKSGEGKSVLIKNIATLLKPDSGTIEIDGVDIIKMKNKFDLMNKFGYLFQNSALFDSLSVWENISFRLINNFKISREKAKKIAIEKLDIVDLNKEVADLYPSELSGGMQKRVSLARAIACDPDVIFFDEPTTGLDPITSEKINDLIIKTVKITGVTAITITHDIHSAKRISDRIVLLSHGKIVWEGNKYTMNYSNNELLKGFLSSSE